MRNRILTGVFWVLAPFGVSAQSNSACHVAEDDLFGDFEYESGPGDFSSFTLFWEHGDYIFNIDTKTDDLLVGEWSYDQCVLQFSYDVDGSRKVVRLEVKSLKDGVLVVTFPRSASETLYRRAA